MSFWISLTFYLGGLGTADCSHKLYSDGAADTYEFKYKGQLFLTHLNLHQQNLNT